MTTFLEPVKEDILAHLAVEPATIRELADVLQRPYTTVQQAHKLLRDEGKIMPFDRKARNARWSLGQGLGPRDTIPSIVLQGKKYKMTEFKGVNNLPAATADAAHDLLKAWTIIATTAERMDNGIPNDILMKRLNRQKVSLNNARNVFEAMAFFCTQIIENPKFWDVVSLNNYPQDQDWEDFIPHLQAMYDHYFSNNTTNQE